LILNEQAFTSPLLKGKEVSALIPQKPPIELVDTLWYNDDKKTISGFTIPADHLFCEDGLFREPGLIENIAQTAALRVGYMVSLMVSEGQEVKPPTGFIGAIKKLSIYTLPLPGTEIMTEVTIENVVFDVTIIKGIIKQNGDTLAECEMKIFLKKD
jgi:3-hydroxyacyl-[acyl-carrier-protein] dehydratase